MPITFKTFPRLRVGLPAFKGAQKRQRILALDDDLIMLQFASHTLNKHGFSTVDATTCPQRCMVRATSGKVDILILDYRIPPITGADVARQITSNCAAASTAAPKMIAVTTNPTPEVEQDCQEAGISFVLNKPFNAKQFELTIGAFS